MNLKMMEDYRVDGILISVCHDHINLSEYQRIMDKGTPWFSSTERLLSSRPHR